jgi:hypothetical protein
MPVRGLVGHGTTHGIRIISEHNQDPAELVRCRSPRTLTLVLAKLSMYSLYRPLFFLNGSLAIATNIVGAFVFCWGIAVLLVTVFSCNPVHEFWDKTIPSSCLSTKKFFIANAVPIICADIMILALPMRDIWHRVVVVAGIFLLV